MERDSKNLDSDPVRSIGATSIGSVGANFTPVSSGEKSSSIKTLPEDSAQSSSQSGSVNAPPSPAADLAAIAGGTVLNHGRVSFITIPRGQTEGGIADGLALRRSDRYISVASGGVASNATAYDGGTIYAHAGGSMHDVKASGNSADFSGSPQYAQISVGSGVFATGVSIGDLGFGVVGGTNNSGAILSGGTVSGAG